MIYCILQRLVPMEIPGVPTANYGHKSLWGLIDILKYVFRVQVKNKDDNEMLTSKMVAIALQTLRKQGSSTTISAY